MMEFLLEGQRRLTDEGVLVKLKKSLIVRNLSDEWVRANML